MILTKGRVKPSFPHHPTCKLAGIFCFFLSLLLHIFWLNYINSFFLFTPLLLHYLVQFLIDASYMTVKALQIINLFRNCSPSSLSQKIFDDKKRKINCTHTHTQSLYINLFIYKFLKEKIKAFQEVGFTQPTQLYFFNSQKDVAVMHGYYVLYPPHVHPATFSGCFYIHVSAHIYSHSYTPIHIPLPFILSKSYPFSKITLLFSFFLAAFIKYSSLDFNPPPNTWNLFILILPLICPFQKYLLNAYNT